MEEVFKALADESRRKLLDALFERDGQTLSQLERQLPEMTRFGVMNHLNVLAQAGLVTSRKVGREKFHYLNPIPLQMVADRWIGKYQRPFVGLMVGLRDHLENPMTQAPAHQYVIFIHAPIQTVWDALTSRELTPRYYMGSSVHSDWQSGSPYQYRYPDGNVMLEGEVIEAEAPHKLVTTFVPRWDPEHPEPGVSKATYLLEDIKGSTKLTLIHDDLAVHPASFGGIREGWSMILSELKTLLERSA